MGTALPEVPTPRPAPLLTDVSKLWLPQNTRANGSDVPEMSRGARSLLTHEERNGGHSTLENQDPSCTLERGSGSTFQMLVSKAMSPLWGPSEGHPSPCLSKPSIFLLTSAPL